ncbi:hypothetical protein GCM10010345_51330 [Streptomyces canarius]|uniref:Uncharacterized protein n=1 Tax=Streptomyces canarius TaxID=285453 RepID=A0ABQ3CT97_9ACTN|nr:hypothetical protein GCM10010345_51330 [Streptomyces canarius]
MTCSRGHEPYDRPRRLAGGAPPSGPPARVTGAVGPTKATRPSARRAARPGPGFPGRRDLGTDDAHPDVRELPEGKPSAGRAPDAADDTPSEGGPWIPAPPPDRPARNRPYRPVMP